MEPGLPRSRNDAGRRRPPRAPRHHLRDECRKLSAAHGYRAKTAGGRSPRQGRSEEHTSELQSLMRISYAVFCLKKKNINRQYHVKRNIAVTNTKLIYSQILLYDSTL